jgi:hypothetical protein
VDTTIDAQVFDIDGLDNPRSVVADLHARRRKTICYIDAGTWESWRSDAGSWPRAVIGRADDGWPGEYWVDIRQTSVLMPLIETRLEICRAKGFDGVEFDNVDGYENDTGFALSGQDQLVFNRDLAAKAQALGLAAGLKNDVDQVAELVGSFDFEIDEECVRYDECAALQPFVAAGKAVFHVEYSTTPGRACASSGRGLSTIVKHRDLDAWREACLARPGNT